MSGAPVQLVGLVPRIICDFETASTVDLKTCGAAVYAEHPNTEVLCLVGKREGGNTHYVWSPLIEEYTDLGWLQAMAEDATNIFVSHAAFEQFIWKNIMVPLGMPELPPERWEDTQATAAWKSCPLKLEKLLQVLGANVQKDMEGSRLTIGLSKANRKTGMLDRTRETIERVIEYCKTDVDGEEIALNIIGDLSPAERKVWLLDQDINHRGISVDMDFVRQAQMIVERASVPLLEEFRELTGGINPTQVDRVKEWCASQGVVLESLKKDYLAELLGDNGEEGDAGYESLAGDDEVLDIQRGPSLPDEVRTVLEIRAVLGSASIKKLNRLQHCVCGDGRSRGFLQYHAAHPGRWGGRLFQPQNFPRGTLKVSPDLAIEGIMSGDPDYLVALIRQHAEEKSWSGKKDDLEYCGVVQKMSAIEMVGSSLRHALVAAKGKVFQVGDYAGIELRVGLAIAGQHDKCELLASGADVYSDMAVQIYNKQLIRDISAPIKNTKWYAESYGIDTESRTIGKHTILGCVYGMGAPKFNERYCSKQPFEFAQKVVNSYRTGWAPKVVELWNGFNWAVTECVRTGRTVMAHGCTFRMAGDFMAIDLPNGWQTIWYYKPAMRPRATTYGVKMQPSYQAMKSGKWVTVFLYGGIVFENVDQALSRGILVEAMGRLNYQSNMPVVLSVHDEAVTEVWEHEANEERFVALMEQRSPWIEKMGVPIKVEAWLGKRYRK